MSSGRTYRIVIATTKFVVVRTVVVTCHGATAVPAPVTAVCATVVHAAAPLTFVPVTAVPTARSSPSPFERKSCFALFR